MASTPRSKMKYGKQASTVYSTNLSLIMMALLLTVNLGKSGLKVSKVIVGTMTYGSSKWQDWVLEEEESIKHIKAAYDAGINTFDTADVDTLIYLALD